MFWQALLGQCGTAWQEGISSMARALLSQHFPPMFPLMCPEFQITGDALPPLIHCPDKHHAKQSLLYVAMKLTVAERGQCLQSRLSFANTESHCCESRTAR